MLALAAGARWADIMDEDIDEAWNEPAPGAVRNVTLVAVDDFLTHRLDDKESPRALLASLVPAMAHATHTQAQAT